MSWGQSEPPLDPPIAGRVCPCWIASELDRPCQHEEEGQPCACVDACQHSYYELEDVA